ncbi:MAG: hypothetical protein N4A53_00415 [Pelagimonas sp.]|jgi:hypothetical protein|nr:hypothetical protein [Pelagimonas sp.]
MNRVVTSMASIVLFALLSVAARDYLDEARQAGQSPTEFGLSGWRDSVANRGAQAARQAGVEMRRGRALNLAFPAAPAGWQRHDLSADLTRSVPEMAPADPAASGYVYRQGAQVIVLQGWYLPPHAAVRSAPGVAQSGRQHIAPPADPRPIVLVQDGVAFHDHSARSPEGWHRFRARIGTEIALLIDARADPAVTRRIIRAINLESLRLRLLSPSQSGHQARLNDP